MTSVTIRIIAATFTIAWTICYAFEAATTTVSLSNGASFHHVKSASARVDTGTTTNRPLVLIPGFAQTIDMYLQHIPALSQQRDLLIYQVIGTGRTAPFLDAASSDDDSVDVSLPAQVRVLEGAINSVFGVDTAVDLVGFSMGGRIALAAACLIKDRIERIHITGVGLHPSQHAEIQFYAWEKLLRQGNVNGFAWNVLLSSYHAPFLHRNINRLPTWVETLSESHTTQGLLALLDQTHKSDWSVESMASKLQASCMLHLLLGQEDRMVTLEKVKALKIRLASTTLAVTMSNIPECGHAVPIEQPRFWRQSVLQFLDAKS